jgi:AcrR family transcriptional regulator
MPKPKGNNADLYAGTHSRIIEAATALFEARGFDAVTAADIAAAAKVAQGTVFHHFGSKRGLFIAVHDAYQERLVASIDVAAASGTDPWDRFRLIWRAYLQSTADPGMRQILLLDGPRVIGLEAMRARDRETAFAFVLGEVTKLIEAGAMMPADPYGIAILLFGALDQAAFEIADFGGDPALRARLIAAMDSLMQRLRA